MRRLEWPLVGVAAAACSLLGFVGFSAADPAAGPLSILDRVYRVIQLFSLESGAVAPPVPLTLEVARFLAPCVAGYAVVRGLLILFADRLRTYRIRFLRGHAVICGLGAKGSYIAQQFLDAGKSVVAIEANAENPNVERLRSRGVPVLIGPAEQRDVLSRARAGHATAVVSTCGDDWVNVRVAAAMRTLNSESGGDPLACIAHIHDLALFRTLKSQEIAEDEFTPFRLDFFNVNVSTARLLTGPAFDRSKRSESVLPASIVIVGWSNLAESLLLAAANRRRSSDTDVPRFTADVIDPSASREIDRLFARNPGLADQCQVRIIECDIDSPEFQRGAAFADLDLAACARKIFVCLDDRTNAIFAALTMARLLEEHRVEIVVCGYEDFGFAELGDGSERWLSANITWFSQLTNACNLESVLGGTHEILARAIHQQYLDSQAGQDEHEGNNPSLMPWERLPAHLKESNRRQSDDIGNKLNLIGARIVPAIDSSLSPFSFAPAELETLARLEHERWMKERIADGWRLGERKDIERRLSPDLVPWEELDEESRKKDRSAVTNIPRLLGRCGFTIERRRPQLNR